MLPRGRGGEQASAAAVWALSALARDAAELRAVLHPLGFLCFPLYRGADLGVCVHVWADDLPTAEIITSPIHSHSWDLLSYVLFGRIGNEIVATEAAPFARASHRLYRIESAQGLDRVTATSQYVQCAGRATRYASAGEAYELPGGAFHSTVVADRSPAATVLVAHTIPGGRDRSLGPLDPPDGAESWRIPRQPAGFALSRTAVEAVLDRTPPPP